MKNILYVLIFFLLTHNPLNAQDVSGFSCSSSSSQKCGDMVKSIGVALGGLVGLVVPHMLTPGKMDSGSERKITLGIGQDYLKESNVDLYSGLNNQASFLLLTNFNLQLYNKDMPSLVRYGIGGGYKFYFDQNFLLIPSLNLSLEKIENDRSIHVGPEINLDALHSINDNLGLKFALKSIWYKKPFWKISTGVSWGDGRSSNEKWLLMLNYQENKLLKTKIFSLDVGWAF